MTSTTMKDALLKYIDYYHQIIDGTFVDNNTIGVMPNQNYFIGDDILVIPNDEGESRYPYGKNGFNFWTYSNGYMHCNEGLFSPFLRACEGSEPKIAFFVGEDTLVSLTAVPKRIDEPSNINRFTVFSKAATFYVVEMEKFYSCLRTFVKDRTLYFSVYLLNKTQNPLEVYTSSYLNPFLKHALVENSTDRWFRQVKYHEDGSLGYFSVETFEERDRGSMSSNYGVLRRCVSQDAKIISVEATTSRYEFVGGNTSSLHTSKAIKHKKISGNKLSTTFTETGICADLLKVILKDDYQMDTEFSYMFEEEKYESILKSQLESHDVEGNYVQVHDLETEINLRLICTNRLNNQGQTDYKALEPRILNPFNRQILKQVEFCSEIKGFIQLSHFSLIGIRDIFQAIEGYLFYKPKEAKTKMLEALSFENLDGRMPRQYSLPKDIKDSPAMDLRPFIDQGVWVISTISTYLKFTKDFNFLSELCGYYDIVNEHNHTVVKNSHNDSVLEHLIRIMDYLLSNQDTTTKCIKALYGDWNDALDGLGKSTKPDEVYGNGVSVMATLQVYQNLQEMKEILELSKAKITGSSLNRVEKLLETYGRASDDIKKGLFQHALQGDKLVHGWGDEQSYFVGSHCDPDNVSRDGITSNAFWILSGLIKQEKDVEQRKTYILSAYQRLSSKYGMKTFEPAFLKGTHGVGRIPNLPAGTAENGAAYIHASMFGVMSLFAIGQSELAFLELEKLLPFTHEKVSVSPYVLPNSYGLNTEFAIDGESMQDWQTGSSNVFLKTWIRYIAGFEPYMNGIKIQPPKHMPFNSTLLQVDYLERRLHIKHVIMNKEDVNNTHNQADNQVDNLDNNQVNNSVNSQVYRRTFTLNGIPIRGVFDTPMELEVCYIEDAFIASFTQAEIIVIEVIDWI
jgi:cellobiose phosphorylase